MKRVFLVAAAALLGATTAEAATTTAPGAAGAAPGAPGGAPMQNFGPSPGMPGSTSPQQPSYGALHGQPGSPPERCIALAEQLGDRRESEHWDLGVQHQYTEHE